MSKISLKWRSFLLNYVFMLKYTEKIEKELNNLSYLNDYLTKIKSTLFKAHKDHQSEHFKRFLHHHNIQLLKRLHIISIALMVLYLYYFFTDFILLAKVDNLSYRIILATIHFLSFFISFIYLFIYRKIKGNDPFLNSWKSEAILSFYILFYGFLGVSASINSQQLTGNVDAYIAIIIGIAVLLHIRPLYLFFLLLVIHSSFYIGLNLTVVNEHDLITKQINSTATVIIAFFISVSFYTLRKNAFFSEASLKEKEDNFKKLFDINPFPLVLTSAVDGRVIEVNKQGLEFYGASRDDIANVKAADFYRSYEERIPIIAELRKSGQVRNQVIQQKVKNGEYKWVILNYELIDFGNEKCILTGVTDITDLKKIEADLIKSATIDLLTGISNRRSGIAQIEKLLTEAKRNHFSFTLCFIDVNNLKMVNDQYGHAEGDNLIKRTCEVIQEFVAKEDIFMRYGGDEFILVFPRKNELDVNLIWEKIIDRLSSEHLMNQKHYPISVSHGLFYFQPDSDISIEEMIQYADEKMYEEKFEMKKIHH